MLTMDQKIIHTAGCQPLLATIVQAKPELVPPPSVGDGRHTPCEMPTRTPQRHESIQHLRLLSETLRHTQVRLPCDHYRTQKGRRSETNWCHLNAQMTLPLARMPLNQHLCGCCVGTG